MTISTFKVCLSIRIVGHNEGSLHEVARMLEKAAERIRGGSWGPDYAYQLVDSNGNQRGTLAIDETIDEVVD